MLSISLYGCWEKEVTCKEFDDKNAMFVSLNWQEENNVTFYSNKGDSVVFLFSRLYKTPEYSTHEGDGCTSTLDIIYKNKNYPYGDFSYLMDYVSKSSVGIYYRIIYSDNEKGVEIGFNYNPNANPVRAMEDGVLVNGVYYKDVVILTADNIFDKVYVSKDMGVIMATVKDSDVVWTINKPVK